MYSSRYSFSRYSCFNESSTIQIAHSRYQWGRRWQPRTRPSRSLPGGAGNDEWKGNCEKAGGAQYAANTGPLYILEAKSLLGHENTEYSSRQVSTPPFLFLKDLVDLTSYVCTGWMGWMTHRKWKESEQQPGTAGPGNMFGCCLMSFHFLWAIHPIRPVVIIGASIRFCILRIHLKSYPSVCNPHPRRPSPWVSTCFRPLGPNRRGRRSGE